MWHQVFIAEMPDGSDWVLVGSANLTDHGMFFNQEACIELSSVERSDLAAILEIKNWFDELLRRSRPIDMKQAKAIWGMYGKQIRVPKINFDGTAQGYYAVKTTSGGPHTKEHWPVLKGESVVAIGWEDLDGDPSRMSETAFRKAVRRAYPHYKGRSEDFAYNTFRRFIDMPDGSLVLVCRGYAPNQVHTPVHIYAFARVIGPFYVDAVAPPERRFKRPVVLQTVDQSLQADVLRGLLGKGSLMKTMHDLDRASVEAVAAELGIQIEV